MTVEPGTSVSHKVKVEPDNSINILVRGLLPSSRAPVVVLCRITYPSMYSFWVNVSNSRINDAISAE